MEANSGAEIMVGVIAIDLLSVEVPRQSSDRNQHKEIECLVLVYKHSESMRGPSGTNII